MGEAIAAASRAVRDGYCGGEAAKRDVTGEGTAGILEAGWPRAESAGEGLTE